MTRARPSPTGLHRPIEPLRVHRQSSTGSVNVITSQPRAQTASMQARTRQSPPAPPRSQCRVPWSANGAPISKYPSPVNTPNPTPNLPDGEPESAEKSAPASVPARRLTTPNDSCPTPCMNLRTTTTESRSQAGR
ncbi:hypothetical protein VE03_07148 [Pseudogymnoascus sp. 23342-1-I1]|nr:hypothetical protein VE03_07148 [Pseudogymnoascus sp. 23342-1-I1]